jgi:hypothetical protein
MTVPRIHHHVRLAVTVARIVAAVRTGPSFLPLPARGRGVVGAVRFDPGWVVIPTYNEAENCAGSSRRPGPRWPRP